MLRSGFGGREGQKSARSAGKIRVADKSGDFLSLVRDIAGTDLLFCVDALSINNVAIGDNVTAWNDACGVWSTNFAESTNPPTLGVYNGKRVVSFPGTKYMSSAATVSQLSGKSELTILWFQIDNSSANFATVLEMDTSYANANNFILGSQTDSTNFSIYIALRQNDGAAVYNEGAIDDAFADASLPLVPAAVFTRGAGTGKNTCVKPYVNGTPVPDGSIYSTVAGNTANNFANKTFFLGSRNSGSSIFNGSFGCFIAIMRSLTTGEVSRLSAAMLDRWNVGNGAARV
jgi:hypothetical protein|tara:strand:- start:1431 stop:2294 length:864 start_codon:yes stop_codon:yes gene_type:complete